MIEQGSISVLSPHKEFIVHGKDESIKYRRHGSPSPLIRWHSHPEYELHFIQETEGRFFVGDFSGHFKPGNLVLTGPGLPHNWISDTAANVEVRDIIIQFKDETILNIAETAPDVDWDHFRSVAKNGVEYTDPDFQQEVGTMMNGMKDLSKVGRLSRFLLIIELLVNCKNYRKLASFEHRLPHTYSSNSSKSTYELNSFRAL